MLKKTDAELLEVRDNLKANNQEAQKRLDRAENDKKHWTVSMEREVSKLKSVKFYESNERKNKEYFKAEKFNKSLAKPVRELSAEMGITEKKIALIDAILNVRENQSKWQNHLEDFKNNPPSKSTETEDLKKLEFMLKTDREEIIKCMDKIGQNRDQKDIKMLYDKLNSIRTSLNDAIREVEVNLGVYTGPDPTAIEKQKSIQQQQQNQTKSEPSKNDEHKRLDTLYNHVATQQKNFTQEAASSTQHSQAASKTQAKLDDVKMQIDDVKKSTDKKEASSTIKIISLGLKDIATSIKSGMESITQLKNQKQTKSQPEPERESVATRKFGR